MRAAGRRLGLATEEKQRIRGARISRLWQPRPSRRNEVTTDERARKRICALYKEKYTLRELADWFRTSYETIRTILREEGVARRPQRNAWKPKIGTSTLADGYIKVFVGKEFAGAPASGWIYEHRLVMQKELGRPLKPWEIVHHIDRNRQNNSRSNLKVLSRIDHPTCISCPYFQFYKDKGLTNINLS